MRSTLAQLNFDVIRFVPHPVDVGRVEGVPQQAARPARARRAPQPAHRDAHGVGGRAARADARRSATRPIRGSRPTRTSATPAWLAAAGAVRRRRAAGRRAADRAGRFDVESILRHAGGAAALAARLDARGADVLVCSQEALEQRHRASISTAAAWRWRVVRRCRRSTRWLGARRRSVLALEGIGNPDNVGGLFRTAAAFGAGGSGRVPAPPIRSIARRCAPRWARCCSCRGPRLTRWPATPGRCATHGYRIAALTPRADAIPIDGFACDAAPAIVLLLGAGAPVWPRTLALADDRVRIPIVRRGRLAQRHGRRRHRPSRCLTDREPEPEP